MRHLLIKALAPAATLLAVACSSGTEEQAVRLRVEAICEHVCQVYNTCGDQVVADSADAFDHRYFGHEYAEVLHHVEAADSMLADEEGFFDYDHWIQGQDWDELHYSVDSISFASPTRATVRLTLTNMASSRPVDWLMVKEQGQWMIGDIVGYYPVLFSELEDMRRYLSTFEAE